MHSSSSALRHVASCGVLRCVVVCVCLTVVGSAASIAAACRHIGGRGALVCGAAPSELGGELCSERARLGEGILRHDSTRMEEGTMKSLGVKRAANARQLCLVRG